MIKLTRLRQNTPFILNPDHIERVDTHVDTVVRLTTGAEYVVNETGDDIVRMTIDYRSRVLAAAGRMAVTQPEPVAPAPPPAVVDVVAAAFDTAVTDVAPADVADEIDDAAPSADADTAEPATEEVTS